MDTLTQYLLDEITLWMPQVIGVVLILMVFYILSKIIKKIIIGAATRLKLDNSLTYLLTRTSNITLMVFALVTILGTLGINVSALVAGLGLTGFALGYAMKDTVSNLLSGVLILLYRPFTVGCRIKVSGYEGIVVSIDLRYTELDAEGNKILIPNAKLFTDPITVINE